MYNVWLSLRTRSASLAGRWLRLGYVVEYKYTLSLHWLPSLRREPPRLTNVQYQESDRINYLTLLYFYFTHHQSNNVILNFIFSLHVPANNKCYNVTMLQRFNVTLSFALSTRSGQRRGGYLMRAPDLV